MADRDAQSDADPDVTRVEAILAGMTEADLAFPDPPASVWAGIDAAVHADRPKIAPEGERSVPTAVEYRVDATDTVIEVDGSWVDFAEQNGAPELAATPTGRTLWDVMDGDEIRDLWRFLVERVRVEGHEARVPFRCDGPDVRRWYEMAVIPEADGQVRFRSVLQFEEPRATVGLLDHLALRDHAAEAVAVCSWCARGSHEGEWLDIEDFVRRSRVLEAEVLPPVDYGICGACRDAMTADLLVPADRQLRD